MDLQKQILSLSSSTGIDIKLCPQSFKPDIKKFKSGIFCDNSNNKTYFILTNSTEILSINGVDKNAYNYALLFKKIIENAVYPNEFNKSESLKLYFTNQLNALQINMLKNAYKGKNDYFVIYLVGDKNNFDDILDFLKILSQKNDVLISLDENSLIFLKHCQADEDYNDADHFARVLYNNIHEELQSDIKLSIGGTAHDFEQLFCCYENARLAYSLGSLTDRYKNIYSFKEYIFVKILTDIDDEILNRHLDIVIDQNYNELLKDTELIETADIFIKNSLNLSETSRDMFIHRNTLIYRLNKIQKSTGLNIRNFNDAMTFKIISVLLKNQKIKIKEK